MKNFAFIAVLCALWSCTMAFDVDICARYVDNSGFYLCEFTQVDPFVVNNTLGDLTFSLVTPRVQDCDAKVNKFIYATQFPLLGDCAEIASDNNPTYSLKDATEPWRGLNITYPAVNHTSGYNQLVVTLDCDVSANNIAATSFTYTTGVQTNGSQTNYTYTVSGSSRAACPVFSLQRLIQFIQDNRTIFAIVFGLLGLTLTFLGLKFFRFAVFTITSLLGTLVCISIFFQFTSLGSATWVLWTVFAIAVILGVVLGVVAVKLEKVGYFCVGAALGCTGGLMFYNAILLPALGAGSGTAPLYITLIVCGIIAGIVGFFLFESVLIIATSLIGSYLVVRVISMFTGGFPNEVNVAENLQKFDAITYAYLAGIIVLAIVGIYVQFKTRPVKEDKEGAATQGNYAYYRY